MSVERGEVFDSLDHKLSDLISDLGKNPVPVPNVLHKKELLNPWLETIKPAGIVLSGGNDLGEFPDRDATERQLIQFGKEHHLPLLGICRGMQMLAHWSGVEIKLVNNHVRSRHRIIGEVSGEVNSYHKYSISYCPQDFKVMAQSEDGEIEAIKHLQLPWEGWMWHPERENPHRKEDLVRLKELFCG